MRTCQKCGFTQPPDRFCAQCGVDMNKFKAKKSIFKNVYLQFVAVFIVISTGLYFFFQQDQLRDARYEQALLDAEEAAIEEEKDFQERVRRRRELERKRAELRRRQRKETAEEAQLSLEEDVEYYDEEAPTEDAEYSQASRAEETNTPAPIKVRLLIREATEEDKERFALEFSESMTMRSSGLLEIGAVQGGDLKELIYNQDVVQNRNYGNHDLKITLKNNSTTNAATYTINAELTPKPSEDGDIDNPPQQVAYTLVPTQINFLTFSLPESSTPAEPEEENEDEESREDNEEDPPREDGPENKSKNYVVFLVPTS